MLEERSTGAATRRRLVVLTALCVATLCWPAAAGRTVYDGAARVLSLRQMTVVYPARDDGGLARFSAENRAGFLRESAELDVAVVRDDRLTEAQREGNLLVLGWDNALLAEPAVGGAPDVRDDGWRWLGLAGRGDEDLVASHRSPWNPTRWLTFYSRIDRDLDRLSPLPLIGSDWVILRRYRPVAQGMFTEAPAWPPTLDEIGQQDRRGDRVERRVVRRSEHYAFVTVATDVAAADAADALAAREAAWQTVTAALGVPEAPFTIELFVYADDEAKSGLTGVPDPWHSLPREGELHAVARSAAAVSPHEDVHVIARPLLGAARLSALFEGLAVWIERGGDDGPLATDAAWLASAGLVPTVDELLDETRFRALTARRIGWPAAGLLFEWIATTHGHEGVAAAYGLLDGSAAALGARLGVTAEQVESGFAAHVAARAAAGSAVVAYERRLAEARRRLDGGDLDGAVAIYRELVASRPDDHAVRYRLGLALLEGGRTEESVVALLDLIERTDPAADARWHVFGHYLLGRSHEKAGDVAGALAAWRAMLELPDVNQAHRTAREAIERVGAALGGTNGDGGTAAGPTGAPGR